MFPDTWRLDRSPFANGRSVSAFYASCGHEEALARLEYLVDNARALGILLGASGVGKSFTLDVLANRLQRRGHQVSRISFWGMTPAEMIREVALGLGANPHGEQPGSLWSVLSERCAELALQKVTTVILGDDVHQAPADLVPWIYRLLEVDPRPEARRTVLLTAPSVESLSSATRLLQLANLRVDLPPLEPDETAELLATILHQQGGQPDLFTADAARRIHELSAGYPRQVQRLADIALVAAAGAEFSRVTTDIVEAVASELVLA